MRIEFTPVLMARLVLACLGILSTGTDSRAGDWLTESERDFFFALGADAVVDGRTVRQGTELSRLPGIARRAEEPLRRSIEAYLQALEKMKVTPDERATLAAIQRDATMQMRGQLGLGVIKVLLGQDPWDSAIESTNGMMKYGRVTDVWDLQARWLERALEARAEAEAALGRTTRRLEERLGARGSATAHALAVEIVDRSFRITGRAGSRPLEQPVVQVILHKIPTGGKWIGVNALGAGLVQAMGVDGMSFDAAMQLGRRSGAQARAMDLPLVSIQLLPTVMPGKSFAVKLGLPTAAIPSLQRVEVRVWSGGGWFTIADLPGLDGAKQKAIAIAERDRLRELVQARKAAQKRAIRAQNELLYRQIDAFMARGMNSAIQQEGNRQQMIQQQGRRIIGVGP